MGIVTQKKRLAQLLPSAGPGRWPGRNPQLALFDFEPVSLADLDTWMDTIPHVPPLRRAQYIKAYDVAGKIARAKANGKWPPQGDAL